MESNDTEAFKPPYMSFQTFWNFIGELGEKPLPPRIDRSLMASKSGTDQANLAMALSSFGLIDEQSNVLPLLDQLTSADRDGRKTLLAELVDRHYGAPMEISRKNGTSQDLEHAFRDSYPSIASADTRRKSITFFLHAAREAGLELSVHFPKGRSGAGAPGAPKAKRPAVKRKSSQGSEGGVGNGRGTDPQAGAGDTYSVDLASGGTVSVVVKVNLFALTTEDRDFVIDLVDKLKGYKTPGPENDTEEDSS